MNKEELKKEFINWCDEPMSANGNDREEMFEKIWQEGKKTHCIDIIKNLKQQLTMKKDCKHKNKVYSAFSYSNNNGITSPWICKECGFEGEDFVKHCFNNEYEETKRKFGKEGTITFNNEDNTFTDQSEEDDDNDWDWGIRV